MTLKTQFRPNREFPSSSGGELNERSPLNWLPLDPDLALHLVANNLQRERCGS